MNRTEERNERMKQVRKMYEEKIPEKDIAKAVNMSVSTVRGYIAEMGLKRRDWEEIRKNVVEMYSSGIGFEKIEKELGVSRHYICSVIKKSGISKRRVMYIGNHSLIDENTVFADNRVVLEQYVEKGKPFIKNGQKVRINKIYTDLMPIFGGIGRKVVMK